MKEKTQLSYYKEWKILEIAGIGSFGAVYKIQKEDMDDQEISALKVVSIPSGDVLENVKDSFQDEIELKKYFSRQVSHILEEVRILQKCRGHENIVRYEEHDICERKEEIGWDLYIRMEFLQKLPFSLQKTTQYDVIKMWKDIANALIFCEEHGIIHRDIKPSNILYSPECDAYKLSDFGTARKVLSGEQMSTRAGTERYMAPEIYKNQAYDKSVDYYSLGCVAYYYLNRMRHVFMPPYPAAYDESHSEKAEQRRIRGEGIPNIPYLSKEINKILRKSLAYKPGNRYGSARQLYEDLSKVLDAGKAQLQKIYLNGRQIPEDTDPGNGKKKKAVRWVRRKGNRKWLLIAAFAGSVMIIYRFAYTAIRYEKDSMITTYQKDSYQKIFYQEEMPWYTEMDWTMDNSIGSRELVIRGWMIAGREQVMPTVYGVISGKKEIRYSVPVLRMNQTEIEKRVGAREDTSHEKTGYEIKYRVDLSDLPDGDYMFTLYASDKQDAHEWIVKQDIIGIQKAEMPEPYALEMEEENHQVLSYERDGSSIHLNPDKSEVMLRDGCAEIHGWMKLSPEALLNVSYQIDGEIYTVTMIKEMGGEAVLKRYPDGRMVLMLKLPFLSEEEHILNLLFTIGGLPEGIQSADIKGIRLKPWEQDEKWD